MVVVVVGEEPFPVLVLLFEVDVEVEVEPPFFVLLLPWEVLVPFAGDVECES